MLEPGAVPEVPSLVEEVFLELLRSESDVEGAGVLLHRVPVEDSRPITELDVLLQVDCCGHVVQKGLQLPFVGLLPGDPGLNVRGGLGKTVDKHIALFVLPFTQFSAPDLGGVRHHVGLVLDPVLL